jgi:pimeloyl-ACP methyl ester carboxylesterase
MKNHPGFWRKFFLTLGILIAIGILLPYAIPPAKRGPLIAYQQMLTPESKFISVNGSSINIEDYVPSGVVKDTLILVHGFGGSTYSWCNNISTFVNAGYRVVAVDMKGFGLSNKDRDSSYSHAAQAGILASVASEL